MDMDLKDEIIDNISEGIVAIDDNSRISIMNKKAKEIFGIFQNNPIGHDEGQLDAGDIIIIGDNCLGYDDGGICEEDFKTLGIKEKFNPGIALIYIGIMGEGGEYELNSSMDRKISLCRKLRGKTIEVYIDFSSRVINIDIDGISFPYNYIKGAGHIVILDKHDMGLKFFQAKGYSIRKEELKLILKGNRYLEKIKGIQSVIDPCGMKLTEVLGRAVTIDMMLAASRTGKSSYENRYDEINGRPVRCSVFSADNKAACLKVEDLSELKRMTDERDELLEKLNVIQDEIYNPFDRIKGVSTSIRQTISYAKRAAVSDSTILILGESGTGKSILAEAIHRCSPRRSKRFVEINCGAIPDNLLESELFGYEQGAFTGADKKGKMGLLEYAYGGTVFLDEITEMPLNLQVKMLHVIQNRKVLPVGANEYRDIDVRFICASNRNIKQMVENGTFREDLYYRINVMPIAMPPLRDRKEDMPYLCEEIITRLCAEAKMPIKKLSRSAFNKLSAYSYPGNIRELENILERALYVSEAQTILPEDILLSSDETITVGNLKDILEAAEKKAIISALKIYKGDRQLAMKTLQIGKTSFYDKIKKYNIPLDSAYAE